jgi:hypothetical protein
VNVQQIVMTDAEREAALLDIATQLSEGNSIDFESNWETIKKHGLDVLKDMLVDFLLKRKSMTVCKER